MSQAAKEATARWNFKTFTLIRWQSIHTISMREHFIISTNKISNFFHLPYFQRQSATFQFFSLHRPSVIFLLQWAQWAQNAGQREVVQYRARNMALTRKVVFFERLSLNHTRKNNKVDIFVVMGSGDKFSKQAILAKNASAGPKKTIEVVETIKKHVLLGKQCLYIQKM